MHNSFVTNFFFKYLDSNPTYTEIFYMKQISRYCQCNECQNKELLDLNILVPKYGQSNTPLVTYKVTNMRSIIGHSKGYNGVGVL